MDFWTGLLQLVLTPAAAVAVIAYATRGLFAQLLHRDLEHFKQLLQREGEQHKKLLEVVQFEHQTKFSWAHQKQAEVISQLYGKLANAQVTIAQMTHPVQFGSVDRAAQQQAAADAFNALTDYFEPNRLFLSEKRSEEVEAIIKLMRYSFNQFSMGQTEKGEFGYKSSIEAWKRVDEEVRPLLKELRREFRRAVDIPEMTAQ